MEQLVGQESGLDVRYWCGELLRYIWFGQTLWYNDAKGCEATTVEDLSRILA